MSVSDTKPIECLAFAIFFFFFLGGGGWGWDAAVDTAVMEPQVGVAHVQELKAV